MAPAWYGINHILAIHHLSIFVIDFLFVLGFVFVFDFVFVLVFCFLQVKIIGEYYVYKTYLNLIEGN